MERKNYSRDQNVSNNVVVAISANCNSLSTIEKIPLYKKNKKYIDIVLSVDTTLSPNNNYDILIDSNYVNVKSCEGYFKILYSRTNFLSILNLKLQQKIFRKQAIHKSRQKKNQSNKDHSKEITQIVNSNSIIELVISISESKIFPKHETFMAIVLEKGRQSATGYLCNTSYSSPKRSTEYRSHVQSSEIDATLFNKIFGIIKKSKNKYFTRATTLPEIPGIIGTFLGKEFQFKNHALIFITSRNDFLPIETSEKITFDNIVAALTSSFESILEKEKITTKLLLIQNIIDNYPYFIKIHKKTQNELNSQNEIDVINEKKEFSKYILSINNDTFIIEIEDGDYQKMAADIFHFRRIKLLGELLNTLKHELSNPLFGISLASNVLNSSINTNITVDGNYNNSDSSDNDMEKMEFIGDIEQSSIRCQNIIKNFSELYSEQENLSHIEIEKFIKEVLTLTKSETKMIKKTLIIDDNIKGKTILTNPTWPTQILFNLIINASQAIKYANTILTPEIMIQIKLDPINSNIDLYIEDNGPGVPTDKKEKLFTPFYTTKENGTGLGLSICKNLVEKMNGTIEYLESYEGRKLCGAIFHIKIPVERNKTEEI